LPPPALHPFPTRRSSDLSGGGSGKRATAGPSLTCGCREFGWTVKRITFGDSCSSFATLHSGGSRNAGFLKSPETPSRWRDSTRRSEEHTSELQSLAYLVC